MKRLLLTIIGTFILSLSCYSQQLTDDEKAYAKQYYDKINDIGLKIIYGVEKICPYGYAKYNYDFSTCYGCETEDTFNEHVKNKTYVRTYVSIYEQIYEEWSLNHPWDDMIPPPPPPPPPGY